MLCWCGKRGWRKGIKWRSLPLPHTTRWLWRDSSRLNFTETSLAKKSKHQPACFCWVVWIEDHFRDQHHYTTILTGKHFLLREALPASARKDMEDQLSFGPADPTLSEELEHYLLPCSRGYKINFLHLRLLTNLISHHKPHPLFLSRVNSVLRPQAPDQFFAYPMSMHSSGPSLQLFSTYPEKASLFYHLLNVFLLFHYLFKLFPPLPTSAATHNKWLPPLGPQWLLCIGLAKKFL